MHCASKEQLIKYLTRLIWCFVKLLFWIKTANIPRPLSWYWTILLSFVKKWLYISIHFGTDLYLESCLNTTITIKTYVIVVERFELLGSLIWLILYIQAMWTVSCLPIHYPKLAVKRLYKTFTFENGPESARVYITM